MTIPATSQNFFSGNGSPNGRIAAGAPNSVYIDAFNGNIWTQSSGVSSVGWILRGNVYSGPAGGQVTDVSVDGILYGRKNKAWLALAASNIPNTPAGNIASTNVQAALNELDLEKAPASGIAPSAITGTAATGFSTDGIAFGQAEDFAAMAALLPSTSSEGVPYNAGSTITGDISLDRANGIFQEATLTGSTLARTLNLPANGTKGLSVRLWLNSDASGSYARTLALAAGVDVPSNSGITFPFALAAGESYIVILYCLDSTHWRLAIIEGGFPS